MLPDMAALLRKRLYNTNAMSHIVIPIPPLPGKQEIEVEVTINNQKQQLRYRVELFYWDDCSNPMGHRADCISEMLSHHDPEWMVYYIGSPTDKFVPITFVSRESRKLLQKVSV
ncbi:hypothetical protein SAMN04488122_5185 [Chitinophaga arvensicola]|uniref:Uncharacterized protein n=2 Tax=Chitinophaga arvensicola TaxID=29529 RepID=A0A1I0S9T3_9BACT|nr:hypothetical protein SAMN04488122_5185 [Chitinophaga arvensicola]